MPQQSYIAIATHAMTARIQRGKRRSKYDQAVSIERGDTILLVSPEPGSPPFVVRIPQGDAKLRYHPGNFVMGSRFYDHYGARKGNEIVYQDRWFVIYTNLAIMTRSMMEMIKNVPGDYENLVPVMERIVIKWCENHDVSDTLEKGWNRYFKLRELFTRPGTAGEGRAALAKGAQILQRLVSALPLPQEDVADDSYGRIVEWQT